MATLLYGADGVIVATLLGFACGAVFGYFSGTKQDIKIVVHQHDTPKTEKDDVDDDEQKEDPKKN